MIRHLKQGGDLLVAIESYLIETLDEEAKNADKFTGPQRDQKRQLLQGLADAKITVGYKV